MEIVNLQVGNSGMKVGSEFFKQLLACKGQEELNDQVFCHYSRPRTLLIDLDKENAAFMKNLTVFQGLDDSCFIAADGRPGNWSAGHYTEGQQVLEKVEEMIRKNVEHCEKLQGFQMFHSAGGCSGGGFGTLIAEKIKDLYYEKTLKTVSVFYKSGIDDRTTEPYNAVFSMNSLIEFSDVSFVISNEIISKFLEIPHYPRDVFKSMNQFIARACFAAFYPVYKRENRFGTLLKYASNLVPFTRLHFLDISFTDKPDFANQVTDESFSLGGRSRGKLFSSLGTSKLNDFQKVRLELKETVKNKSFNWAAKGSQWINFLPGDSQFSCFTSNGTGLLPLFSRINKDFEHLFKRKAFVHWYTGEGLDSMEFECAQGNFKDLIEEYQHYDAEDEFFNDFEECQ